MINVESLLKDLYTVPVVNFYSSYEEMESLRKEAESSSLFGKRQEQGIDGIFTEVLSRRNGLILSEPGYGKTRFLRELKKYTEKDKDKTFFIELKLFSKEKLLENFIYEQIGFRITKNSNTILCFDGLDEVGQDSFYDVVRQLKLIMNRYHNILFFISCRLFFHQKFPVFKGADITYITIEKFNFQQVKSYLVAVTDQKGQRLFTDTNVNKIINDFNEPNWESIILIPRYLEKFVEFYLKNRSGKPTRSDLYNFFINERLKIEDTKRGVQDGIIIRRLLEKVALIMEIYQKNDLNKDELITVLEDIQSNMTGNFLDIGKLQILFDHSLWIDYGETIAFEERSLQEYLASCELLRIGRQKLLYDIVVDQDLNEIHPSWFNTLGFIVDQNVDFLEPLIDFGRKDVEKIVGSEEYNKFLAKVNTSKLSKRQKIRIFKKVFSQYQKELIWIDCDVARRLAGFYDDSLAQYLKDFVDGAKLRNASETAKYVIKGNVAYVVGFFIKQNILSSTEKEWWKGKLIIYANDDNDNGDLQRQALFALEGFKDKSIIKKVKKAFNHPSELVRDKFIEFCRKTNPNYGTSLQYFIKGTKQKSIYARYGLCEVTEKNALRKLLIAFTDDGQFLKMFVEQERIFEDKDVEIMEHIDNYYDNYVKNNLIKIVFALIELFERNSLLLKNIARLLKKREPDIVDVICKKILTDEKLRKFLFDFETFLSIALTREKVAQFIEYFKNVENVDWILFRILYAAKGMQKEDGLAIYEEGRKYLGAIYTEVEKQEKKQAKQPSEEKKLYQEFCFKLEPEKGKYMTDVFQFFLNNYEKIKSFTNDKEIDRLKKLASVLLRKIDTQKQSFKVLEWDKENKGIKSFRWSSNIPLFENCVKVAEKLSINLTPAMRKNVINFIPLAQDKGVESIFRLIGDVQASELTYVISIYNSAGEKRYFRTTNFIELVEKKCLKEAIPVIKSFIEDGKLTSYERRESLKVKELLQSDAEYLWGIFKKYLKSNNIILSEIANEFLIKNYNDCKAIKWRLTQIKDRKFKFIEPKGGHSVGSQESELHEKRFAKPLMELSNPTFLEKYIELLKFSLELLKMNKNYWAYVQYIWEMVVSYVDNLKFSGKYEPIEKLKEFVKQNDSEEGINWFRNRLRELKRSYQFYLGRPKSINDCIKRYNSIKSKQYLDIISSSELYDVIKKIVNKNLRNWIEVEGAAELLYDSEGKAFRETRIQKTIQPKLKAELELLGITTILREPQKLDDERVDFYISYGFSPSFVILVEIKKSRHPDLGPEMNMSKKKSFKKMKRYMEGFSADYGVLLVFNVHYEVSKWEPFIKKVNETYAKIKNFNVIGIDAAKRA